MDYVRLGKSNLIASQLGFGCCPMGRYGWGEVSDKDLVQSVVTAINNGVNFFDTADVYGLGESERILGKTIKHMHVRSNVIIATKFGVRRTSSGETYYDNSAKWINDALDASLKRLDVEYIDLYQIHYRDNQTPLDNVIETLEKKRSEGKIRYYGLSNISSYEELKETLPEALISCQMEYSLANRSQEKIIKAMKTKNLELFSWGSLGQGILTGKYDVNVRFSPSDRRSQSVYVNFHGEKLKKNMEIVDKMQMISKQTGKTLPQIAIRWILDYLGFGVVLVGVKNQKQIINNLNAFGWALNSYHIESLDDISKTI